MQTVQSPSSHVVRAGEGKRFDVLGAHLVWKARGDDTGETMTVAAQTLAPGEQIPCHRHNYPEVFFVTSGQLVFSIVRGSEEVEEQVSQGDTVVVAANSFHAVRNVGDANATLLDIACYEHQLFFDDVDREHRTWQGLSPEQTMQKVGEIAQSHTLEFRPAD